MKIILNNELNLPLTQKFQIIPATGFLFRGVGMFKLHSLSEWRHVAPPPLTHAICPGPPHSVRFTHGSALRGCGAA